MLTEKTIEKLNKIIRDKTFTVREKHSGMIVKDIAATIMGVGAEAEMYVNVDGVNGIYSDPARFMSVSDFDITIVKKVSFDEAFKMINNES